jgi:dihydroorotate dehydrogenase electron transfer subunit
VRRVRAEVLSTRKLGAYHSLTLVAPEIADRARPGQFLAVAMPTGRDFTLRRNFSIHQASRRGGWAGTFEFVVEPGGPGREWLAGVGAHEFLEVFGPLGKGFAYPKRLTNCLLVAEGHGAASLYFLAQELKARHKRVDMIVGAEGFEEVFKPIEGKRLSQSIAIMTADGSLGERGTALDALPEMVERCGSEVVYAAGPTPMLERVAAFCLERKIPAQVAVEGNFGCGLGLCFSCVVPVVRKDGSGYDNVRACVDGPVFNPARVLWDRWLTDEPLMIPTPPEGLPVVRTWPG